MTGEGTIKRAPSPSPGLADRVNQYVFLVLVACLPFDLRFTVLGLSNLQWLFVIAALASVPGFVRGWRRLVCEPVVRAAAILALVHWASAILAEEFTINAIKGAVRLSVGVVLVCMALERTDKRQVLLVWSGAAVAAATYGVIEHLGLGVSQLFRTVEFWLGNIQRLSGSFEYPNTAATFFAMSLPIVWMVPRPLSARLGGAAVLWSALMLTYSRGAFLAALGAYLGLWVVTRDVGRDWKTPVTFTAVAGVVLAATAFSAPLFVERLSTVSSESPIAAEYRTNFNTLQQRPGVLDEMTVTVRNVGMSEWRANGRERMVLSYHWFDTIERRLLENDPMETVISEGVGHNEIVTLDAPFRTPDKPGSYLLIWDMRSNRDWFSRMGVIPGIIEVEIDPDAQRTATQGDVSRWYRPDPDTIPSLDSSVPRMDLWRAAGRMALDNPILGVGADNFRLLYGRYLGYSRWDTNIRSNSLYLELIATCGLAGLLAFGFVVRSIKWTWGPVSLAFAVFLLHGLVDVFLMTTSIYFGLWILVGLSGSNERLWTRQ